MKNFKILIIFIIFFLIGFLIFRNSILFGILYVDFLIILEFSSFCLVNVLRKEFPWLITSKDEYPSLNPEGLQKFLNFGYDKELGWIRKPNTSGKEKGKFGETTYNINKQGSRKNPSNEKFPKKITCVGDSFTFARQVNDNETWCWYLSKFTKTNVLNYGVGNYGFDQALLRLKREYEKNKTPIVIFGVVPSTIVRILTVWKHYNEFGNTFGFTPTYILKNNNLKLIPNFINSEEKFQNYRKYLPQIQKFDYFYNSKFKKEMIKFPYLVSILSNIERNIPLIYLIFKYKWFAKDNPHQPYPPPMKVIMNINLKLRKNLFKKNTYAITLFEKLIDEFIKYSKEHNFFPVFLFMPQKDDVLFIKSKKDFFYKKFIDKIKKKLLTLDLTGDLILEKDLNNLYSDDNKYGGHYSKFGNKLVAEIIYKKLKEEKII